MLDAVTTTPLAALAVNMLHDLYSLILLLPETSLLYMMTELFLAS